MLSPVMGEDICDIGPSMDDLGDTDKSWEQAPAVGKTHMTERELEKPKASPIYLQKLSDNNLEQMWFELIAAGTLPEQMNWQPKCCVGQPV